MGAAVHVQDSSGSSSAKKADAAEHPKVFRRVGLLVNEPPGHPGCSLCSHPKSVLQNSCTAEGVLRSPKRHVLLLQL